MHADNGHGMVNGTDTAERGGPRPVTADASVRCVPCRAHARTEDG